jgi:hypothetical protein
MKKFSDFSINIPEGRFSGDKIKISKVVDKPIVVLNYKISDSKFEDSGKRLDLQIEIKGEKHIVFTGSKVLLEMIIQVDRHSFPFETVITKEEESYQFN